MRTLLWRTIRISRAFPRSARLRVIWEPTTPRVFPRHTKTIAGRLQRGPRILAMISDGSGSSSGRTSGRPAGTCSCTPPAFWRWRVFVGNDFRYIADRQGELQSRINTVSSFVISTTGKLWTRASQTMPKVSTKSVRSWGRDLRARAVQFQSGQRANQHCCWTSGVRQRRRDGRGVYHGKLRYISGTPRSARRSPDVRGDVPARPCRHRGPAGGIPCQRVHQPRIIAFSPRAFVRALIQTNDDEHEARANVFRYTYRPGADLFVVYNENRNSAWRTTW